MTSMQYKYYLALSERTDKDLKVGSTFDSIAISKNHKQKLKSKVSNKK